MPAGAWAPGSLPSPEAEAENLKPSLDLGDPSFSTHYDKVSEPSILTLWTWILLWHIFLFIQQCLALYIYIYEQLVTEKVFPDVVTVSIGKLCLVKHHGSTTTLVWSTLKA